MLWILFALIISPIAEILIIVQFGIFWGTWPTIFAIFATALIGLVLVRSQGTAVLRDVRHEISVGLMPAQKVLEGLCLLLSATLLVIPGFITDALGFFILIPVFRNFVLGHLKRRIQVHAEDFRKDSANVSNLTIDGHFVDITDHKSSTSAINSLPPRMN